MIIKSLPYLRISIAYLLVGIAWIVSTDALVVIDSGGNFSHFEALQTLKGLLFVGITSCILYFVSKSGTQRAKEAIREKEVVFRKTTEGTQYILNNFIHKMQLMRIEAEQHPDFDRETLELARKITDDAKEDVAQLIGLTELNEQRIHDAIYRRSAATMKGAK